MTRTGLTSRWKVLPSALAFLVGGGLVVIAAQARAETTSEVQTPNGAARTTRITAKVLAIDPAERTVTLQSDAGQTTTIDVPRDVKAFDQLKVGDHVDVDYYEGVAIGMLPPGTKPSRTERQTRSTGAPGSASMGREVTASAEIVSVDPAQNLVTFKGARGTRTVHVQDPHLQQMLAGLRPGQVVQVTYRQATAASIRPSAR
jgi:hypothetical protein